MKKFILVLCVVLAIFPSISYAKRELNRKTPCTEVLNPTEGVSNNARGVALIYNIKREFDDKRTSLSIHALHLPEPAKFGNFDGYRVLAYIPNKISWIFPLTQYRPNNWAGIWDEISPSMRPTHIKVHLYNTKQNRIGPVVLEKSGLCLKQMS